MRGRGNRKLAGRGRDREGDADGEIDGKRATAQKNEKSNSIWFV